MASNEWKNVGSLRLSKSGNSVVIVVNKKRYTASAAGVLEVLNRLRDFTSISEPTVSQ